MYRHAFLIRENKRSKPNDTGTDVDHVLCAESDTERDDWVRVLAAWGTGHYIQPDEANNQTPNAAPSQVVQPDVSASATAPAAQSAPRRPSSQSRKLSKEDIAKGTAQPLPSVSPSEPQLNKLYTGVHQPYSLQKATHRREDSAGRASVDSNTSQQADLEPMLHQRIAKKREHIHEMPSSSSLPANLDSYTPPQQHRPNSQQSHHADSALSSQASQRPVSPSKASSSKISGPMNGQLIGTANFKPSRADRQNKVKSSFWNFARSGPSPITFTGVPANLISPDKHPAVVAAQAKPVFGVPLEEAVQRARVKDGFELPAVVFRCVEYLQAKSAVSEEGLYRLS